MKEIVIILSFDSRMRQKHDQNTVFYNEKMSLEISLMTRAADENFVAARSEIIELLSDEVMSNGANR